MNVRRIFFAPLAVRSSSMTTNSSAQGHLVLNSLPFHNRINEISRHVAQDFDIPVGPAHLDFVHRRTRPQPEVWPQIVLRNVAGPALHFADLRDLTRLHGDARPD